MSLFYFLFNFLLIKSTLFFYTFDYMLILSHKLYVAKYLHLAYVSLVVRGYCMHLHLALRLNMIAFISDMSWVVGVSVFRVLRGNPEDHQWGEERPRALTQRVMKPRGMLTANCTWVCVCVCANTKVCECKHVLPNLHVCRRGSHTVVDWANGPAASGETADSYWVALKEELFIDAYT